MPWQDVCPFVRLSVTRRYSVETAKQIPRRLSQWPGENKQRVVINMHINKQICTHTITYNYCNYTLCFKKSSPLGLS